MGEDLMHYDRMVQDALKRVVHQALQRAADKGLPGGHHFYITFRTDHPDAVLSAGLKNRYPREMTIILQHQFWGLKVHDDYFEVGLSFNRIPEGLYVPFAAIKGFYDPSVQFGLEFAVDLPNDETAAPETEQTSPQPPGMSASAAPMPAVGDEPEKTKVEGQDLTQDGEDDKRGEVVNLDAFRKKS